MSAEARDRPAPGWSPGGLSPGPPSPYAGAVKKTQVLGLLLWRGGSLFVGASAVYYATHQILLFVDIPATLRIGGSLVLSGVVMILVSMVMENYQESRDGGHR